MVMFGTAIGLSAFLLFWVQPLIGQVVLPAFGGTPGVWATVLVFFQGAVLIGYSYSHASVTRLGPRRGAMLHLAVAATACLWLAAMPIRQGDPRASDLPVPLDVLRMLVATVGLPVFALTTTTPLLSAWYASTRGPQDRAGADGDPYRLYALSNAASLAALLAYPLILGPQIGLSSQVALWAIAFLAFFGAIAMAVLTVLRRPRAAPTARQSSAVDRSRSAVAQEKDGPAGPGDGVGWTRRSKWLLLAAVPSGLLAAVTNFIATDLIAAPLLWIGPLAVYLGSFIVAFSARGRRLVPLAVLLAPAAVTLLWTPIGSAGGWPIASLVVVAWSCFAIIATALHGRLAEDRPSAVRLTEFYLVQSAGGVTGGAFVAIAAPLLFDGVWELPVLLVGALAALAVTGSRRSAPAIPVGGTRRRGFALRYFFTGGAARLVPYGLVSVAVTVIMVSSGSIATPVAVRWFGVGALILLVGAPPRFLALSTAMVLALATFVIPTPALLRDRSFFGVTEVVRSADGRWIQLMNGTTVHGVQATDPRHRREPALYYARSGPLGDVFEILDEGHPTAAIAIAGLGAGGIAAYAQPTHTMTFYEIDPVVVRVAGDTRYFSYLSDAPVRPRVVLGDARLSLRGEPDASFELVILDAFSSDSPPAHLLTVEALLDDRRVLRPGGLLVVNISNRYYDLAPALGAAGERLAMTVLERRYAPTPADAAAGAGPSVWVVATADAAVAERFRAEGWRDTSHDGVDPLTDDHTDVLRFLEAGL